MQNHSVAYIMNVPASDILAGDIVHIDPDDMINKVDVQLGYFSYRIIAALKGAETRFMVVPHEGVLKTLYNEAPATLKFRKPTDTVCIVERKVVHI